jgi:hypothetical protein
MCSGLAPTMEELWLSTSSYAKPYDRPAILWACHDAVKLKVVPDLVRCRGNGGARCGLSGNGEGYEGLDTLLTAS